MLIKDGNKAVGEVAYKFSDICAIYPITPSSPMASTVDKLSSKKETNVFKNVVKVVQMQSEAGVAGCMHGSLLAGSLSTTFTSSQGLLLMIPNMYKMAGEMLPAVIHVAARSIATHALSIFGDHQDIYATRQTGFCMLSSSSVEDASNIAAIAHLSSIKSSLPFLHFFDGFRTSHEVNTIENDYLDKIINLVDFSKVEEFRNRMLIGNKPLQKGMAENEDIYFQSTEARNNAYEEVADIVNDYMNKVNKICKKDYKPFNYYGAEDATNVIVAMGSVCDTIKMVVDVLNKNDQKVGLVEVHLYRPFSTKYLLKVLPESIKNMAVLDRTKESGSMYEPLCLDVIAALKNTNIDIVGGRYGLSGKNTTPAMIKSVFDMLNNKLQDHFVIGIDDDVTNLSLPLTNYKLDLNAQEMIVYGYGSDGMVSACKELLQIICKEKNKFVQGYFEYDSKKSGGVTKSHLRISDEKINAPYYVENPKCIVITKKEYLDRFDTISNIKENGIILLNINDNDLNNILSDKVKSILTDKKVKILTIDANKIVNKYKLNGKLSKIMEIVLLEILGIKNALNILEDLIKEKFKTKGEEVINNNISAIKEALKSINMFDGNLTYENSIINDKSDIFDMIDSRRGNELKVSDLLNYKDGSFSCDFNKNKYQYNGNKIPKWIKENCIQCNMCSFVCPHGVIRPFKVDEGGIPLIGSKDKKEFLIAVNGDKCTGCGLCIKSCPGKKGVKALEWTDNNLNQESVNKLFTLNNEPEENIYNVRNSQFNKPLFEYSGACAGCGEAGYIKLLTQLFQNNLLIANATGCSSIYGGSVPNTAYNVSWANSLFEDNAEFGLGMYYSYKNNRLKLMNIIKNSLNNVNDDVKDQFELWLNNIDDSKITNKVKNALENLDIPKEVGSLINYIPNKDIWCIGGDGWAYDIGFGGIDQVLSSNENVNILILDSEVYSNTGGQASKSSQLAQVAEFADMGKKTVKKDLFKIAMCYPNTYVASVCMGANPMQTIKAFKEAKEHQGPSIIIAYSTCIEQGIKHGMNCSLEEQKQLVDCGYLLLMRYDSNKLYIDSKEPDFSLYEKTLLNEVRYKALEIKNKSMALKLLDLNKKMAQKRYMYYTSLIK